MKIIEIGAHFTPGLFTYLIIWIIIVVIPTYIACRKYDKNVEMIASEIDRDIYVEAAKKANKNDQLKKHLKNCVSEGKLTKVQSKCLYIHLNKEHKNMSKYN
jgi:hypothetical protein